MATDLPVALFSLGPAASPSPHGDFRRAAGGDPELLVRASAGHSLTSTWELPPQREQTGAQGPEPVR